MPPNIPKVLRRLFQGASECHSSGPCARPPGAPGTVVLTGNPNCGKTSVFNALTGLRAKVGNYAGVTVERKEGRLLGTPPGSAINVLDLPGTYSLSPQSVDEQIASDALFRRLPDIPAPTVVVVVVDASNLERHLYYATQVIELGYPTLVALNMMDMAEKSGHRVDAPRLAARLGVPVLPLVARDAQGIASLRHAILTRVGAACAGADPADPPPAAPPTFVELPPAFQREVDLLAGALDEAQPDSPVASNAEALLILSDDKALAPGGSRYPESVQAAAQAGRRRLEAAGLDWQMTAGALRYAWINRLLPQVVFSKADRPETVSERIDRVTTHQVWGIPIFLAILAVMFAGLFTLAKLPTELLEQAFDGLGHLVLAHVPPGHFQSLLEKGVIHGVGAVVVFLPQICLLFFFLGVLEDSGYMARAAFIMDRLMSKVGLSGKSFIPLLSCFACAVPGIMATRVIETHKDRLITILVSPLMGCSARLPVYVLLISACLPGRSLTASLLMVGLYVLGLVLALLMAWVFKKTLLKGAHPMLIMELPPYHVPRLRATLHRIWDRAWLFLQRAGTVILAINLVLWGLMTFPRSAVIEQSFQAQRSALVAAAPRDSPGLDRAFALERERKLAEIDNAEAAAQLAHSFAGRLGRFIEPALAPIGFDWKIGIGIVSSFAAREVFVSTMAIIYRVGHADMPADEPENRAMGVSLRAQTRPDGSPVFTLPTTLSLLVFFVLAQQCVSTAVVVRRETNSWRWPIFQWAYLAVLAWLLSFLVYHSARLLGLQ